MLLFTLGLFFAIALMLLGLWADYRNPDSLSGLGLMFIGFALLPLTILIYVAHEGGMKWPVP